MRVPRPFRREGKVSLTNGVGKLAFTKGEKLTGLHAREQNWMLAFIPYTQVNSKRTKDLNEMS